MNILQIITPARVAGAERSTASLCEHLQAAGHQVVVGCKAGSPLIPVMRGMGLDVRPLAISGKANLIAPLRIAGLARQIGARVIHSHLSTAAAHSIAAGRIAGLPSIAHVRALNKAYWYRKATRVIAVSHAVRDHLAEQGMDASRIDVVYNGIDPDRYYQAVSREEARRALGIPGDALIVGVVAHLSPRKGHPVLLEAMAQIAARHPRALALLLGEGDDRDALAARAAELGLGERVLLPGFHANVLPYYAAMDVVALPSVEGEGLPRALLEGGMLGLPSVGTRLSGVPEIIREGETGFIVPIGDAASMADRLDMLLRDVGLRERMGRAAHEYVASTFTIEAMVCGVLESYRRAGVKNG